MNEAQGNRTMLGFLRDEGGATAIEYAIIAAGIASAIAATVSGLGTSVKKMWESVALALG
jgi:pilus assembly protein Flp/PilA